VSCRVLSAVHSSECRARRSSSQRAAPQPDGGSPPGGCSVSGERRGPTPSCPVSSNRRRRRGGQPLAGWLVRADGAMACGPAGNQVNLMVGSRLQMPAQHVRSNPSKSWETAGAERARSVAAPGRSSARSHAPRRRARRSPPRWRQQGPWSGGTPHPGGDLVRSRVMRCGSGRTCRCRWRGDSLTNPMRGVRRRLQPRRRTGARATDPDGVAPAEPDLWCLGTAGEDSGSAVPREWRPPRHPLRRDRFGDTGFGR
jgi:hypothetical protein